MVDLFQERWTCPTSPVAVDQDLYPYPCFDARRSPVPSEFPPFFCHAITPTGLCPAHSTQSDATCSNPDHSAARRWYGQIIYWAWEFRRPYQLPSYESFCPAAQILVDPVPSYFLSDALLVFRADVHMLLSDPLSRPIMPPSLANPCDPMLEDFAIVAAAALVSHCSRTSHDDPGRQYARFWHHSCDCLNHPSLPDNIFW